MKALHAITSVLAVEMGTLQRRELVSREGPHAHYFGALAELTPESWRQQFGWQAEVRWRACGGTRRCR